MQTAKHPTEDELPSSKQLLRSTLIAIVAAFVLLVTIILPAEYDIDPTGLGRLLGLAQMGEIKIQLSKEAEADRRMARESAATLDGTKNTRRQPIAGSMAFEETTPKETTPKIETPAVEPASVETIVAEPLVPVSDDASPKSRSDTRSDEISITLSPGQGIEVKLAMQAGAKAQYEWSANGGVLNYDTHGDGGGQSISYEKGRGVAGDKGVLEAAFDGNHGWFWRNRTNEDVTMTLRTSGAYRELKRVL